MTTNFTMLTFNRVRLTRQALESLTDMSAMNVTIHDDGSEFETQELIYGWAEDNAARVIRSSYSHGTGESRNIVIRDSEEHYGRGDYLYLSDSDVFFKPGWLGHLIKAYEFAWDHGFRVLGGYNHPFHQPVSRLPVTKGSYTILNVDQVGALALQSMLMRWEVWDKYGPFCQTPAGRVCASEDVDFARKITADGGNLGVVSPALVVNTGITNSFGEKIPGWELVKAQCPPGVLCE